MPVIIHSPGAPNGVSRLPLTAVVTSLATLAAGISGAVLALMIGTRLGTTARTDGFFAAYSVYSVVVILATSWKSNIVASLAGPRPFERFDRLCGGVLLIFLALGVLFVALGDPLATLLTGHGAGPAHDAARTALLVLWPAAGGQLFAGLAATVLNVLSKNSQSAIVLALGSLASIAAFVALEPSLRVDALPVSILIGTGVAVALVVALLVRLGWRPSLRAALTPRRGAFGLLLLSSVSNLVGQLLYTVSIVVAARVGPGAATIYSFAFFGQQLVKTGVNLSLPVVLATPLAATWDGSSAALRPYLDDSRRIGLVLLIPIVAAVALMGQDVGVAVLPKLTTGQVHQLVLVFLILSVSIVVAQVSIIEQLALMTLKRYTALAVLSLVLLVFQVLVSLGADAMSSLYAVAAAFTLTVLMRTVALLRMVHGPAVSDLLRTLVREAIPISLAAAASFGVAVLVVRPGSAVEDAAAYAAGFVLFTVATTAFMPSYRVLALRLVRAVRPAAKVRA